MKKIVRGFGCAMNQRQQGMEIHVNFACCVLAACACCYFAVRLMFGTDAEIGGGDVFTVFLESERNARSRARRPTNEMTPLGVLMSRPTSSLLIAANLLIFVMLRRYRVPPDAVAIGLVDVVERREYWRCATSSLSHFDNWHIAMNMLSLWNVSA